MNILSEREKGQLAYLITAQAQFEPMYLIDEKESTPKKYGQSKRKTYKKSKIKKRKKK